MRWCASIVLLNLLLVNSAFAEDITAESMMTEAKSFMDTEITPEISDGTKVMIKLVVPFLMAEEFKTFDKKTSFQVDTFSTANSPLLQVTIGLNPATRDLSSIVVKQDMDADGTMELTSMFPSSGNGQMIAGMCADGYIQCPPGEFDTQFVKVCSFYKWKTVPISGKIDVVPVSTVDGLSGCYCFNSACSTAAGNVFANVNRLVTDASGGIIGNFTASTNYVVTNTSTGGDGVINFFGIKTSAGTPSNLNSISAISDPNSQMPVLPYSNPSDLTSKAMIDQGSGGGSVYADGEVMLAAQQASSKSLYNLVKGTMSPLDGNEVSCQNVRHMGFTTQTASFVETGTSGYSVTTDYNWSCDHDNNRIWFSTIDSILMKDASNIFYLELLSGVTPVRLWSKSKADIATQLASSEVAVTNITADVAMNYSNPTFSYTVPVTWLPQVNSEGSTVSYLKSTPCTWGTAPLTNYYMTINWQVSVDGTGETSNETITDGCGAYKAKTLGSDPECQLKEDVWDGTRPVVANYMPTTFQIVDIRKTIQGSLRAYTFERPWWVQNRVYYCRSTAPAYDFTDTIKRVKETTGSSSMTSDDKLSYSEDGVVQTSDSISVTKVVPSGIQLCKVGVAAQQSIEAHNGSVSSVQSVSGQSKSATTYEFRECSFSSSGTGTWICPIDVAKDETIKVDCGDSTGFTEAVSSLGVMNNMQDAICASN